MYNNPYYNQGQMYGAMPRIQQMENMNQQINSQPYISQVQSNNQPVLLGKLVESIEVVRGMDIPLDGSTSYFPLADGSAIVTKKLQTDGTSKTIVYKPVQEDKKETKYVTFDDLEKKFSEINDIDIEDIKDEIKGMKKELKELKSKKKDD